MEATKTDLQEVILITPRIWQDSRGFFLESFNMERFAIAGLPTQFVQDNHSRSKATVAVQLTPTDASGDQARILLTDACR